MNQKLQQRLEVLENKKRLLAGIRRDESRFAFILICEEIDAIKDLLAKEDSVDDDDLTGE